MKDMYRHLLRSGEDDWSSAMKVQIVLLDRIAEALESIAARLEQDRSESGANKGVRPAP